MNTLEATFKIVTPMFLSGADQTAAEIRGPSIKGALRFWYRAIDPEYAANENEPRIFGGSGKNQGQAMFLMQVKHNLTGRTWDDNFEGFDELNPDFDNSRRPLHSAKQAKTWRLNGIRYLGYSLAMKAQNDSSRKYVPEGGQFSVVLRFKRFPDPADRRRIIASIWLLGHFGSLGMRSRRGFGVLALKSIAVITGDSWEEINELPNAGTCENFDNWKQTYADALKVLKRWFPSSRCPDHSTFSDNTKICLLETHKLNKSRNRKEWEYALDTAGKIMQRFRQRWDLNDPTSDYFRVKQYLCKKHSEAAAVAPSITLASLSGAPERLAFGLPLKFRYSSLTYRFMNKDNNEENKTPEVSFEGADKKRSRSASRIWIRIVEIGENAYPMFFRLDGPLLNPIDKVKYSGGFIDPPNDAVLDQFWQSFDKTKEIEWSKV